MAAGKGSKKKKRPSGAKPPAAAPAAPSGAPARTKPTRTERLDAARRARRRKALLVRAGVIGAVVAVVAGVAIAVAADRRGDRAEQERLTAGSCEYDTRADPLTADNHVPPAGYEVDPPAGGDHDPSAASAGFFAVDGPAAPSDSELVHSLEHGLVVLWYRPDLAASDVTAVRGVFDEHGDDVVAVPRASLDVKVAATSWGRRLLCGEVEPGVLSEFVDLYRDKSPEPGVR